jgi:lysophospholipase L1-like esterase
LTKHNQVIQVLGLQALNDVMIPDPDLFWALKPNLKGFMVNGRIGQQPIDFRVSTNELGLRGPPVPPKGPARRILILGDSCAFGVGVRDDETWPAQLEKFLAVLAATAGEPRDTRGPGIEVINAGVPGYSAFQGLTYLKRRGLDLRPDLVIASFGFNDASSWASRSDSEVAADAELRRWDARLMRSRLYAGLREIAMRVRPARPPGQDATRPRLSPEEFDRAILQMNEVCAGAGVPLVLVIWPYAVQLETRDAGHLGYQALIARAGGSAGIPVVDLVGRFIRENRPLLLDHIHANPEGCRVAAAEIAGRVRGILSRPPAAGSGR